MGITPSRCNPTTKKMSGDEIVPVAPHVAHHAARRRRDGADGRDGDENAHGEERRSPERPPRGHLPLFADESHDQRDARQMAGAEDDAEDAPHERRGQGDQRRAFDGVAEVREELFHDGVLDLCLLRSRRLMAATTSAVRWLWWAVPGGLADHPLNIAENL